MSPPCPSAFQRPIPVKDKSRTLVEGKRKAVRCTAIWYRRDDGGKLVASGIYLYKIETGDFRTTKKMIPVR